MKTYYSAILLLVQLVSLATSKAADGIPQRPNIIFLLSDDQTIQAVGCYGNKDVITPNLDQLANDGVRFLNHYDTTSICMASRCSILTGLYEYRHGCNFTRGDLDRRLFDKPYPMMLRQAALDFGSIEKQPRKSSRLRAFRTIRSRELGAVQ